MNCVRKAVEGAGFTPDPIINLAQDCGVQQGPPLPWGAVELGVAVKATRKACVCRLSQMWHRKGRQGRKHGS